MNINSVVTGCNFLVWFSDFRAALHSFEDELNEVNIIHDLLNLKDEYSHTQSKKSMFNMILKRKKFIKNRREGKEMRTKMREISRSSLLNLIYWLYIIITDISNNDSWILCPDDSKIFPCECFAKLNSEPTKPNWKRSKKSWTCTFSRTSNWPVFLIWTPRN